MSTSALPSHQVNASGLIGAPPTLTAVVLVHDSNIHIDSSKADGSTKNQKRPFLHRLSESRPGKLIEKKHQYSEYTSNLCPSTTIGFPVTVRRVGLPPLECLTGPQLRQPARGRYPRLFIDRGEKRGEALHDIPDRSRTIA